MMRTTGKIIRPGLLSSVLKFLSLLAVLLPTACLGFLSPMCLGFQARPTLNSSNNLVIRNKVVSSTTQLSLSLLSGAEIVAGVAVVGFASWLYIDGSDDRERARGRQEENARYQAYQDERSRQAYVEPRDYWTEEELAPYDGTQAEDGPILIAADGLILNVHKGRNFYGPGGEYHIFAGRDATRFLARTSVDEESPEEAQRPLSMAERAALAGWMFTLKSKYEVVGKMKDFDPSTTSMRL